jgi:hypothetical protein
MSIQFSHINATVSFLCHLVELQTIFRNAVDSNKYYIFWARVCTLALVIRHAMRVRLSILSSVV